MLNLRIHGDNIVECKRALLLVKEALFPTHSAEVNPSSSVLAPIYEIGKGSENYLRVQLIPGYGRWNHDILEFLKNKGSMLREATDAIISIVSEDSENGVVENPVLAIEFCGALSAGNQAWQRCGRGYAFSAGDIPYLYAAEIGGYELNIKRQRKAIRLPNPVVPFSYVTLTLNSKAPALPIFLPSCATDAEIIEIFNKCFGREELLKLI
ncbi:MAG: hypothetical protein HY592_03890, partial [Candidatus Omnitrophica bacterium]|nr:hypothetical protein [Candidatus Omnitrophota bacterium]